MKKATAANEVSRALQRLYECRDALRSLGDGLVGPLPQNGFGGEATDSASRGVLLDIVEMASDMQTIINEMMAEIYRMHAEL